MFYILCLSLLYIVIVMYLCLTNGKTVFLSICFGAEIGWLVLSRLRQEVLQIYLQLQARAEQCTALLAQCISQPLLSATVAASTTTTPGNVAVASQWKASLPKAEALMLQEALRQEQAADMEEILGHVDRYVSASFNDYIALHGIVLYCIRVLFALHAFIFRTVLFTQQLVI